MNKSDAVAQIALNMSSAEGPPTTREVLTALNRAYDAGVGSHITHLLDTRKPEEMSLDELYLVTGLPNPKTAAPCNLPYPWCCQPSICKNRGCCPRDPSCGD
jgi:hypothetical protein